jgi:hypothetical protein
MGRKRWAALVMALFLLAIGCGAGGPRPTPGAHIVVVLRADGSGRVDFWVGGGMHSDRELRDLGGRVTAALFSGKALGPTTVEPGTAFTFARTEVPEAYKPGRQPTFDVVGDRVGSMLQAARYSGYTLLIRPPRVRTSIGSRSRPPGSEYSWKVAPGGPTPTGSIVMHPRLLHWAVEMAVLATAIAAVLTAFISRDRRIAVGGAAAGVVTAATLLLTDGASGDALGTLGHLSGTPLTLVTRLPLAAFPLAVLAIFRLVRLLTTPAPRSGPRWNQDAS